jgi:hypothetical protein
MNGKKSPLPSPLPRGEAIGILAPFSLERRAGLQRERSAERDEGQSLLHSATSGTAPLSPSLDLGEGVG